MAPGVQATQRPLGPNGTVQPKKKFQVVPVPGEFSRGRWKCVDTRGLSNGEFGNYPLEDEYRSMVAITKNAVTLRKKFYRRVPEDKNEKDNGPPVESHIQVTSSVVRSDYNPETDDSIYHAGLLTNNEIEVIVMSPNHGDLPPQSSSAPAQQQSSSTVILSSHTHITPNPAVVSSSPVHATHSAGSTSSKKDEKVEDEASSKLSATTSSTVVAIDNKIVQAMDLVKTHLTFAVREEVETLRSTISDLETRLSNLREENRILRENASPEVIAFITANKSCTMPTHNAIAFC